MEPGEKPSITFRLHSLLLKLVAETGSTLGSAGRQHLAAVAGLHSLAEAVNLLPVQLLGLIGSLHSSFSPFMAALTNTIFK